MNELDPSRRSPLSRRTREDRAYRLVLATGALGTLAIVGFALAIFGVIGAGWPILATLLAVVSFFLLRRTVT
jgi:hypothetical protein